MKHHNMNTVKTDDGTSTCSAWGSWSAEELEREILDRMMHFYADMDGNPVFPNSAEGDLLKLTYHFFKKQNVQSPPTGGKEV